MYIFMVNPSVISHMLRLYPRKKEQESLGRSRSFVSSTTDNGYFAANAKRELLYLIFC